MSVGIAKNFGLAPDDNKGLKTVASTTVAAENEDFSSDELPSVERIAEAVQLVTRRLAIVAEDDDGLMHLASLYTERAMDGAEVFTHPDGASAIARVDELAGDFHASLDLVFSDFDMPGRDS